MKSAYDRLQQDLTEARNELQSKQVELEDARRDVEHLQQQVRENHLQQQQHSDDSHERLHAQMSALKIDLDIRTQEKEDLIEKLLEANSEIASLAEVRDSCEARSRRVEEKLREVESLLKEEKSETEKCESKIIELESELGGWQSKCAQLTEDIDSKEQQLRTCKQQLIDDVAEVKRECEVKVIAAEESQRKAKSQLEEARTQAEQTLGELTSLFHEERASLEKENDELQRDVTALRLEIDEEKKRCDDVTRQQLLKHEVEMEKVRAQLIEDMHARDAAHTEAVDALRMRIAKMQEQLDDSEQAYASLDCKTKAQVEEVRAEAESARQAFVERHEEEVTRRLRSEHDDSLREATETMTREFQQKLESCNLKSLNDLEGVLNSAHFSGLTFVACASCLDAC